MAEQRQAGFTLAEMLAALAILLIGVTTLLASLSNSVGLRRSSEARLAVAQAVEEVVLQAQQGLRRSAAAATDLDLELALPPVIDVPGFPGARFGVRLVEHPERLDVVLLECTASWFEGGEAIQEQFLRVLPRQLPLGRRVQRFNDEVTR